MQDSHSLPSSREYNPLIDTTLRDADRSANIAIKNTIDLLPTNFLDSLSTLSQLLSGENSQQILEEYNFDEKFKPAFELEFPKLSPQDKTHVIHCLLDSAFPKEVIQKVLDDRAIYRQLCGAILSYPNHLHLMEIHHQAQARNFLQLAEFIKNCSQTWVDQVSRVPADLSNLILSIHNFHATNSEEGNFHENYPLFKGYAEQVKTLARNLSSTMKETLSGLPAIPEASTSLISPDLQARIELLTTLVKNMNLLQLLKAILNLPTREMTEENFGNLLIHHKLDDAVISLFTNEFATLSLSDQTNILKLLFSHSLPIRFIQNVLAHNKVHSLLNHYIQICTSIQVLELYKNTARLPMIQENTLRRISTLTQELENLSLPELDTLYGQLESAYPYYTLPIDALFLEYKMSVKAELSKKQNALPLLSKEEFIEGIKKHLPPLSTVLQENAFVEKPVVFIKPLPYMQEIYIAIKNFLEIFKHTSNLHEPIPILKMIQNPKNIALRNVFKSLLEKFSKTPSEDFEVLGTLGEFLFEERGQVFTIDDFLERVKTIDALANIKRHPHLQHALGHAIVKNLEQLTDHLETILTLYQDSRSRHYRFKDPGGFLNQMMRDLEIPMETSQKSIETALLLPSIFFFWIRKKDQAFFQEHHRMLSNIQRVLGEYLRSLRIYFPRNLRNFFEQEFLNFSHNHENNLPKREMAAVASTSAAPIKSKKEKKPAKISPTPKAPANLPKKKKGKNAKPKIGISSLTQFKDFVEGLPNVETLPQFTSAFLNKLQLAVEFINNPAHYAASNKYNISREKFGAWLSAAKLGYSLAIFEGSLARNLPPSETPSEEDEKSSEHSDPESIITQEESSAKWAREIKKAYEARVPQCIKDFLRELNQNEHTCYLSGSTVLRLALGLKLTDFDLITTEQNILHLTPPASFRLGPCTTGLSNSISWTHRTFFTQEKYKIDLVATTAFTTPEELTAYKSGDFSRLSSMCLTHEGVLIDPYHGTQDLEDRIIRAIDEEDFSILKDKRWQEKLNKMKTDSGFEFSKKIQEAFDASPSEIRASKHSATLYGRSEGGSSSGVAPLTCGNSQIK